MNKFKIGDKIICVHDEDQFGTVTSGKSYIITDILHNPAHGEGHDFIFFKNNFDQSNFAYSSKDFVISKEKENNFKIGNKVRVISDIKIKFFPGEDSNVTTLNDTGVIVKLSGDMYVIKSENLKYDSSNDTISYFMYEEDLELVNENKPMEKFDATRLGYYRMRDGFVSEVLYARTKACLNTTMQVLGIDIQTEESLSWGLTGNFGYFKHDLDLVEYLGTELPKELREFKFEAYICEAYGLPNGWPEELALDKVFEKSVSTLYSRNVGNTCTKWEVTMKEILQ